jgi:hypothetical protein
VIIRFAAPTLSTCELELIEKSKHRMSSVPPNLNLHVK